MPQNVMQNAWKYYALGFSYSPHLLTVTSCCKLTLVSYSSSFCYIVFRVLFVRIVFIWPTVLIVFLAQRGYVPAMDGQGAVYDVMLTLVYAFCAFTFGYMCVVRRLGSCFVFFVSHSLNGPESNGRAGAKTKHAAGCQSSPKKEASPEGFELGTLRSTELRTTT